MAASRTRVDHNITIIPAMFKLAAALALVAVAAAAPHGEVVSVQAAVQPTWAAWKSQFSKVRPARPTMHKLLANEYSTDGALLRAEEPRPAARARAPP